MDEQRTLNGFTETTESPKRAKKPKTPSVPRSSSGDAAQIISYRHPDRRTWGRLWITCDTSRVAVTLRRAGTSIPANIAEGQARNNPGEFRLFLGIAKGSLAELETWIMLCERLAYLDSAKSKNVLSCCEEIQSLLAGLQKSLKN